MKQVPISELTPGMVTAADIFSYDMQLIVPKGVVLTENIISRLEGYSIYYAPIEDNVADELSKPIVDIESIPDTESFKRFSQDYERCSAHFRDSLMNSLYRNEPFRANDILRETMALLTQDGCEVNIFDMLLGLTHKESSIYDHCIGTALTANMLSRWLHFSDADQMMVTACGLFHDVGMVMLPQGLTSKPGKLTSSEFEIVKTHTTEGFHLLGRYRSIPEPVKNAALMHHEKCDGSGYPYGLKGEEIDKFSKIITIADIFNAMTNQRSYRNAICPFTVIKFFEDDGIQKYDMKYILTFLENVANSYLNHRVTLSNGMEGDVIFINHDHFSQPVVRTNNNQIINLEAGYYESILQLSANKDLYIEAII